MGKISKKYIGSDQVGAAQIELENAAALKAKSADGLSSQEILEIDPSNLLQMLKHPYLPGDATSALQSVPKQQLDSAVSSLSGSISGLDGRLTTAEGEIDTLQSEMDQAQADILALDGRVDVLEPKVSTLESEMDQVQADVLSLDGRLDVLEPKVSTLESEMDTAQADIISLDGRVDTLESEMNQAQSDISALQTADLGFVKLDGSRAMTGDLSMMPSLGVHHRVTGLADPVDPRDAANKQYVDAIAEGLHVHAPAKVIINETLEVASGGTVAYDNGADGVGATLTLSVALTAYDDYTFVAGDRIIVNGQANKAHNGIYTVGSNGALGTVFTRALDYNTPTEMAGGDFVFVQDGSQYADSGWVEIDKVLVVGTDPVQFVQFSGAGTYTAGDALQLDGTEFNVRYDNTTISLDGSNQLRVDPAVMGRISTLESEMDQAQADIISLDGRLDIIEPKVSTLEGEMDTAQADISALQTGKANTSLNNLDAVTAIPASVTNLESVNTSQTFATEFKINTKAQTASASGSIRVLSGNVEGAFVSGGARLASGFNTNASMAAAATAATGVMSVSTGNITGGTQGSTGGAVVTSGAISAAGVTGATGQTAILTGTNAGLGSSGRIVIETGTTTNAAGSASGMVVVSTGKSLAAASGSVGIYTGAVDALLGFDNRANPSATGNISIISGRIENLTSVAATGSASLISGTHAGLGATGAANFGSGAISNVSSSANSGIVSIRSGNNSGAGSSGDISVSTGDNFGTGNSGNINLNVGTAASGSRGTINLNGSSVRVSSSVYFSNSYSEIQSDLSSGNTGSMAFKSGASSSGDSGLVIVGTGDAPAGNAGNLLLFSGVGASGRGFVQIEASKLNMLGFIDMNSSKIVNLQDPTASQDAATKAYVDAQISSGTDFHKQAITLSAGDIANQYVDLSVQAIAQSCSVFVGERVALFEGLDYSVSVVGGVTRLSFTGPSAVGGAEELVEGQTMYIQCVID